ncbi:hypothetical protein V5T82_02725 [Magnetovibrio sp. PR-2]|uniref:hypothetical protein n=1 Tax=Magnetovibrio sp. PR-2 TaxID=3120356 RepID=UPI002FCE26E9
MPTAGQTSSENSEKAKPAGGAATHPSDAQYAWLSRGLKQPGGKLPLFDELGQQVSERTVRSCIDKGWAEPWFSNPLKPDWIVCKLTEQGRAVIQQ